MVSSTERKAWQTLGGASAVILDPRLCEVGRPRERWTEDSLEVRAQYVSGTHHRGWEAHVDVVQRFRSALAQYRHSGRPVVVETHGMAMTTWLVGEGALASSEAARFWRDLRLPDCHLVDLDTFTVRRLNAEVQS